MDATTEIKNHPFYLPKGTVPNVEGPVAVPKKMMLIFHITTTDPAGAGYNMVRALNQYTPHTARILNTHPNVFHHPDDIHVLADYGDEIEALLLDADVIHLHKIDEEMEIELTHGRHRRWKIKDFLEVKGRKKKIVYHIHGHPYERAHYRENGERLGKKDGPVLASTPDLLDLYSDTCGVQYFPNCVPIHHPMYLPRATDRIMEDPKGNQRYVVNHTVSDRHLKDCDMIEKAVEYVAKTQPVKLWVTEKTPFRHAMLQKRIAHVIFDHMQGYYGLGSLEGLSMGKPVIAGLDDNTIRHILDFFKIGDVLPWQRPRDQRQLNDCLMDLIANPDMRRAIGLQSRKFMEEVWSDEAIANRLAALYEAL